MQESPTSFFYSWLKWRGFRSSNILTKSDGKCLFLFSATNLPLSRVGVKNKKSMEGLSFRLSIKSTWRNLQKISYGPIISLVTVSLTIFFVGWDIPTKSQLWFMTDESSPTFSDIALKTFRKSHFSRTSKYIEKFSKV